MLTGLRWRYVWRGIWLYRTRTVLIILSVAVGIFAFGLIMGAARALRVELPQRYQEVHPASAVLHASPFDLPVVDAIARMPEVSVAEGRTRTKVRYLKPSGEWHDLELIALQDYTDNQVNIVRPYRGAWPPPKHELLVERISIGIMGVAVGDTILVENAQGDQRQIRIAGLTHDMNQAPAQITGVPLAYVSRDTLVWLGLDRRFNELHLLAAEQSNNHVHTQAVARAATDKLERAGLQVYWTEVPKPGHHFVQDFMPTVLIILTSLGVLALLLSGFLVVNVISALLAQQARQIGVMKAVGARPPQIAELYLRMVICFGVGALIVAIPFATAGGRAFARFIASQLNFDLTSFNPALGLLMLQIGMGLVIPVLAALVPVLSTARRTVREALTDTGLDASGPPPTGLALRLLRLQQRLPISRPMRLSLRNTFRRRGRLVRTLIPLILGGAMFMSVLSVRASLFRTLEETLVERGFDVQVQLTNPTQLRRLDYEVSQVAGVTQVEGWVVREGVPVRADETQGDKLLLHGLPAETKVFVPQIVAGRWLQPDDTNALVVPTSLIDKEPEFAIGKTVTVRINGANEQWVIVGVNQVFQPPIAPAIVYANRPYVWNVLGGWGQADTLRILTEPHDEATHVRVAQQVEAALQRAGIGVRSTNNASEDRAIFSERFNIITVILLFMAFLLATVGSLGLMGTISINVLERRREIGVLRAIGASDKAVIRLFVVEGVVISLMSWVGALILAQFMSRILSYVVGMNFAKLPLSYVFDLTALPLWLVIIVTVAALASFVPARGAARLSVRETLAYDG